MRYKVDYCIFCNTSLTNENTSIEHIIPKTLHSSDKLVIEICSECNSYLSREIEQFAIQNFKNDIAHLKLEGFDLKLGRRAKNQYEFHHDKGLVILDDDKKSFLKGEWVIDTNKNTKYLELSQISKNLPDFCKSKGGKMIMMITDRNSEQLLVYKILFEIGFYLFGESFLKTNTGIELKNSVLNKNLPKVINKFEDGDKNIDNKSENVTYELDFDDPLIIDEGNPSKSAFDNKPNITFAILKDPLGRWLSVLNLWGIFEFTYPFYVLNTNIEKKLDFKDGIVLLIETTNEKRLKFIPLKEYDDIKKRKVLLK